LIGAELFAGAQMRSTRRVKRTSWRPKVVVTADGRGVVGRAGTRLVAELADATGLSSALSEAGAVAATESGS
jgi:hypothetical protein